MLRSSPPRTRIRLGPLPGGYEVRMFDDPTALQGFLLDSWSRVGDTVHATLEDIDDGLLIDSIAPGSNTIAWLVWHLSRVADDHVAELAGTSQVWVHDGWASRFDLPLPDSDTGYGHSPEAASMVVATVRLLRGYHDAVGTATRRYLGGLGDDDLGRIVDESYDPPVTAGVRIASVINDCTQHAGQAAFLRGLLERGWTSADG